MSDAVNREVTQGELDDLEMMIRESSEIIAEGVSYDDFLNTDYGDSHVEWAYGMVLKMPGIDLTHNLLTSFLDLLIKTYFSLLGVHGLVLRDPALMRTSSELPRRAPDVQVLLPENRHRYQRIETVGPADLVIEIVSKGTQRIDHQIKHREYERGGVPEYWIIDPIFRETLFFQLNEKGIFERIAPDQYGYYQSKVLSRLRIPVDVFWREDLHHVPWVFALVEDMLKDS
ncbi:MAG: Uma2 family endonuclease [bacterium]|nr:Uma2 family endonuclease [bacterium]